MSLMLALRIEDGRSLDRDISVLKVLTGYKEPQEEVPSEGAGFDADTFREMMNKVAETAQEDGWR